MAAQTYSVFYSFDPANGDGSDPYGIVRDAEGNFYGTTSNGGAFFQGTVFKVNANGVGTVLHSFQGRGDGAYPTVAPTLDVLGNLYGTTTSGGSGNRGVIYKIDTTGAYSVLFQFTGSDGMHPSSPLLIDPLGNLFGTTADGGPNGQGEVYQLTPNGRLHILHAFAPGGDGESPREGALLRDRDGNFYGTTLIGGAHNLGTVFKISKDMTETVLYSFGSANADGALPYSDVIPDSSGNLYGTTQFGGDSGFGTVFKLSPTGVLTTLHSFAGTDGEFPPAGLIRDPAGNLYGGTLEGGAFDRGVVFKVDPSGNEIVLHDFTYAPDGNAPRAKLVAASGGVIYGTAYAGGAHGAGAIFKIVLP